MQKKSISVITALIFLSLLVSTPAVYGGVASWDFFNDSLASPGNEDKKQVESHMTVRGNNNDHLLVGFLDNTNGPFRCRASTSTDGGSTFTDRGLIPLPPGDDTSGDPAVASDTSGTYFITCLAWPSTGGFNRNLYYWVSANGGSSWSGPNTVTSGVQADKPWMATDLKDATSSYRNNVYVCWQEENSAQTASYIKFRKVWPVAGSIKTVTTGTHSAETNGIVNWCGISVGKSGIIYVTWARLTSDTLGRTELRRSFDGGGSFESLTQTIKTFNRMPQAAGIGCGFLWGCLNGEDNYGIRVGPNSNTAIDNNWNLFTVYTSYLTASLADVRYAKATNCITSGVTCTYSGALAIANDGGIARDQFIPQITVSAKSNTIHVVAMDRRNSADNTVWQPWHYHCHLASSSCTAASSFAVTAITTQGSWNFDQSWFVGEYNGIASTSTREVHATWPDTRLWSGEQDYNIWSNRDS